MSLKKNCSSFTSQKNVEQRKKKKKKPTATIRGGYSTQGYRKGDSLDGGQKRVSKFPRGDVPEFSQGGRREGIECTPLRSRTVTFSTLTSAKHISALFAVREWMAQIKKRFLKFPHENNSLPFPIYISSSIPVPLICTQTRFPEQLQRISTDESRRAASIMGITCLKRVLHDVYLGSFKRAAWFNLDI